MRYFKFFEKNDAYCYNGAISNEAKEFFMDYSLSNISSEVTTTLATYKLAVNRYRNYRWYGVVNAYPLNAPHVKIVFHVTYDNQYSFITDHHIIFSDERL